MPFIMTHLIIAEGISNRFAKHIKDLPQFYLGNIAPDAVHNRENYISDYKKASHLCVGSEKWGMITNNDEWQDSVISFLYKHKESEDHDFILGYCCHLLADIYSNIALWIPFKKKYPRELEKEFGNLYHQESNAIDIQLALTYEKNDVFWSYIQKSVSVDLENIIFAPELDRQKEYVLNICYAGKSQQDNSSNKVVTYKSTMDFCQNAIVFVSSCLEQYFQDRVSGIRSN